MCVLVCSGLMTLPRVRSHEIVWKMESVEHDTWHISQARAISECAKAATAVGEDAPVRTVTHFVLRK